MQKFVKINAKILYRTCKVTVNLKVNIEYL